MDLQNNQRILLLKIVKEQIRKGHLEKNPVHGLNGKKPRKQYGLAKMITLYELEMKLTK